MELNTGFNGGSIYGSSGFRYTYEDFTKAAQQGEDTKQALIIQCINLWKDTDRVVDYAVASAYNNENNPTIMGRQFFYRTKVKSKDSITGEVKDIETLRKSEFKANYKIANGIFSNIITQKVQYLLGNGVQLSDEDKVGKFDMQSVKGELGTHIDRKVQIAGEEASLGGVAWAYCYLQNNKFNFQVFNCSEFIPLVSMETNLLMVGIRFWEVLIKNTRFVELYEQDGMTRYMVVGNKFTIVQPKTPYKRTMIAYTDGIYTLNSQEVFELPIVPFYNNVVRKGDLTPGLRNKLDLFDIVLSDFGNNLTDANEVFWVLENYKGQDVDEFKRELEAYRAIRIKTDGTTKGSATPHTVEIPYNARQTCLDILRKQIYNDAMAMDTDAIRGGSLTNVAIKAAQSNLDQKAASFEWGAIDFISGIVKIWKLFTGRQDKVKVDDFIRRTLVNDTEIIQNLMNSPYLSDRTKRERNPYSADDEDARVEQERNFLTVSDEVYDERLRGAVQYDGQGASAN